MRRYLALSAFLHFLIFASFIYRKMEPIDEPIVAVSLDLNEPTRPFAPTTKPQKKSVPEVVTKSENTEINKTQQGPETNDLPVSANSKTGTGPYESGNVTVKPKVMRQHQVVYPQQAKEARVEGAVRLSVVIQDDGKVGSVTVIEGPGFGLNEAAQEALKKFEFSPAEVQGLKVPVRIVYVYRFKLESR